ncbi:MAG TPA: PAS domain S-box protein, partial [Candidatus Hydrogenedentes bacterium]|nr:PAS domain S-box protein [Candidatus Hydrogenedentota bacterium]
HLIDRDYRILLCNRTLLEWHKAFQIDVEVEGKDIFDVYPFLTLKVRDEYEHVFKTGAMLLSEEENRLGDRVVYTETRKIPLLENGIATRVLTVMRDVTDRRQSEIALRESEEKYRALVEMFPHALTIFQDGRVVFANRATVDMFHYPNVEAIVGQDIMTVVADREKERLRAYAQARYTVPSTAPEHYETVLRRADGEEFSAEVHVKMIAFGGRPAQQVLVSDITERKRALQAIQESEERYRDILHNIREGYYEVDLKGNFTFFNKALCRIFGYTAEELRGMNYRRYYPDDERRERVKAIYNEVFVTGQDREFVDWTIIRKDGSIAEMEVSVSLMRDSEEKPIGFRGMVRDVTERKKTAQALQEAEARYRELFENANDVVFTTDLAGKFLSLNKAGERIGGYSREEALQMSIFDIVLPEFRDRINLMMQRKLTEGEATQYEVVVVAKDGRRVPLEVSTRLVYQGGCPVAVQGIARDITDRKRAEEERAHMEAQLRHTQK